MTDTIQGHTIVENTRFPTDVCIQMDRQDITIIQDLTAQDLLHLLQENVVEILE